MDKIIELVQPGNKSGPENQPEKPNITFKVIGNEGSPYNCLFASILQSPYILREQEKILKGHEFSYMDLKHITSEFADDHWEEFKDNLIAQHRTEISLFEKPEETPDSQLREAYQSFINKHESLGTITELTLLSRVYKFNYIVLQKTVSQGDIFYSVIDQSSNPEFKHWLYLRFTGSINYGHWELLEPVGRPSTNFIKIPDDVNYYFIGSREIDLGQQCYLTQSYQAEPKQLRKSQQIDEYETISPKEVVFWEKLKLCSEPWVMRREKKKWETSKTKMDYLNDDFIF